jgi:16S rRNA processing protein RimM
MSDDASALIQLGVVGAPFGVRGWVKLRSHTDPPERLLASGRSGGALTAKLTGVEDRDQAAALRGAQICVPRSELPQRDSKDFYRADLIGCEVVNLSGIGLGVVQHFVETPAQALMVVRGEQEYWVPAVPKHLKRVDLQARRVVVDWDAGSVGAAE